MFLKHDVLRRPCDITRNNMHLSAQVLYFYNVYHHCQTRATGIFKQLTNNHCKVGKYILKDIVILQLVQTRVIMYNKITECCLMVECTKYMYIFTSVTCWINRSMLIKKVEIVMVIGWHFATCNMATVILFTNVWAIIGLFVCICYWYVLVINYNL